MNYYYYYYYEQSLWTHEKDFKKQKERSAIWTNSTKKCPCWWNDCDPDVKEIAGMSETRKFINAFTCANWIQPIISTSYFLYNHLIITLPLTPPPPNVFFLSYIPAKILLHVSKFPVEEQKTNLMSLAILFHFLCAQHVSDINISIIRSLRLCCWITTSVVLFSVRCVLEIWCGWVWVLSVKTTDVVIQQQSRKLLMMGILMSETCWANKMLNRNSKCDIKLVFCFQLLQWCAVK